MPDGVIIMLHEQKIMFCEIWAKEAGSFLADIFFTAFLLRKIIIPGYFFGCTYQTAIVGACSLW